MEEDIQRILKHPPEKVQAWIEATLMQPNAKLVNDHLWFAVASAAMQEADINRMLMEEDRLSWAAIAIMLHEFIGVHNDRHNRYLREISAMAIRIRMIRRFGHREHHPVLDGRTIEIWFFGNITVTPHQMLALKQRKHIATSEDIVEFSNIREKLKLIRVLMESNYQPVNQQLYEWNAITDQLYV